MIPFRRYKVRWPEHIRLQKQAELNVFLLITARLVFTGFSLGLALALFLGTIWPPHLGRLMSAGAIWILTALLYLWRMEELTITAAGMIHKIWAAYGEGACAVEEAKQGMAVRDEEETLP